MKLNKQYLTKNECYVVGNKQEIRGIMVHSTGYNNTNVSSYLNHWNQLRPGGRQVCVHAFIGKLPDGSIGTYQTLPWDMVGWHSGQGANGNANFMGYIGFEICEDDLTDRSYFEKVYREAVELCVYLCQLYGLTEKDIICHSEGHARGIASNHADVMHWFPKFGKSMEHFRTDVKAILTTHPCDNTPTDWARDAVGWAIENDLLKGDDTGDLMLRSPITREQFCVMLKRYHELTSN
jgi:hypothetical protein